VQVSDRCAAKGSDGGLRGRLGQTVAGRGAKNRDVDTQSRKVAVRVWHRTANPSTATAVREDGFAVFIAEIGLDAAGNPISTQTTYQFDGQLYPEYIQTSLAEFAATGTKPNMNIYRLLDACTVEIDRLDATGKVTATSKQSLSRDGETVTVTSATRPTRVWDKQQASSLPVRQAWVQRNAIRIASSSCLAHPRRPSHPATASPWTHPFRA